MCAYYILIAQIKEINKYYSIKYRMTCSKYRTSLFNFSLDFSISNKHYS